jgi:hypothetical protein
MRLTGIFVDCWRREGWLLAPNYMVCTWSMVDRYRSRPTSQSMATLIRSPMDPEIGCRRILNIHMCREARNLVQNYSTGTIIVMFDYYVSWAIFCSFAWPSIFPNSWVLTDESRYMGLWLPEGRLIHTSSVASLGLHYSQMMLISGILTQTGTVLCLWDLEMLPLATTTYIALHLREPAIVQLRFDDRVVYPHG